MDKPTQWFRQKYTAGKGIAKDAVQNPLPLMAALYDRVEVVASLGSSKAPWTSLVIDTGWLARRLREIDERMKVGLLESYSGASKDYYEKRLESLRQSIEEVDEGKFSSNMPKPLRKLILSAGFVACIGLVIAFMFTDWSLFDGQAVSLWRESILVVGVYLALVFGITRWRRSADPTALQKKVEEYADLLATAALTRAATQVCEDDVTYSRGRKELVNLELQRAARWLHKLGKAREFRYSDRGLRRYHRNRMYMAAAHLRQLQRKVIWSSDEDIGKIRDSIVSALKGCLSRNYANLPVSEGKVSSLVGAIDMEGPKPQAIAFFITGAVILAIMPTAMDWLALDLPSQLPPLFYSAAAALLGYIPISGRSKTALAKAREMLSDLATEKKKENSD